MHQAYWGLAQSPFRGHLDPKYFYQGPTQEEALARLQFLVDEHRTLGLLLGGAGSGKSLLLEVFARQLGCVGRQAAVINLAGLDSHEFLWLLATGLGIERRAQASEFDLARAIGDQITANRYQRIDTILLLDDADEASAAVLDRVLRLAQSDVSLERRLTLVMAAQDRKLHRLNERLLELADLRIDLQPWERDDTVEFVKQALSIAGRTTAVFSRPAITRLHDLAGGVPRRIQQLADLALLAGAGAGLSQIEPDTIDAVYQELGVLNAEAPLATATQR